MSVPSRRSKWDQVPEVSVPLVNGASVGGTNGGHYAPHASEKLANGSAALNDPSSNAAARAAAFLSSNLSSNMQTSSPSVGVSQGPQGWLPPGHPDRPVVSQFSGEVNINGCRPEIRYVMTNSETFDAIHEETGATVVTRGTFRQTDGGVSHDVAGLAPEDRPLHLYVTADSQEKVDRACAKLKTLMERPSTTPSGLLMNKVYIPFASDADPTFSLPGKIIGPNGSFVRHIQTASGCKVHLRGKGSSYVEGNTRQEAQEALHLFITGPTESQVQHAKNLSEQLIASVKRKYDAFLLERKSNPSGAPPSHLPPNQNPNPIPPPHTQVPSTPSSTYIDSVTTTPMYTPQRSPSGARPPPTPNYGTDTPNYYSSAGPSRENSIRSLQPPPPPARGPTPPPPTAPNVPYHHASPVHAATRSPSGAAPVGPGGYFPQNYAPVAAQVPHTDPIAVPAAQPPAQSYSEWTPEAIAAYYAYYGMAIPPEYAAYLAANQHVQTAAQPPPPPSKPTNGHLTSQTPTDNSQEMEMEMDDDDTEFVLPPVGTATKGKRPHEDSSLDQTLSNAKRPKYEEEKKIQGPPTDKPFWASTASDRSNVLAPSARQPDR